MEKTSYYLGIDLDNDNAVISYFQLNMKEPEFDGEYNFCIELPKKVKDVKIVITKDTYPFGSEQIYIPGKQIEYLRKLIEINLIGVSPDEKSKTIKVTGWAESAAMPTINAYSGNKKLETSHRISLVSRPSRTRSEQPPSRRTGRSSTGPTGWYGVWHPRSSSERSPAGAPFARRSSAAMHAASAQHF